MRKMLASLLLLLMWAASSKATSLPITPLLETLNYENNAIFFLMAPGDRMSANDMKTLFEINNLPIIYITDFYNKNLLNEYECNGNQSAPEGLHFMSNLEWRSPQKSVVSWLMPNNITDMEILLDFLNRYEKRHEIHSHCMPKNFFHMSLST